jgi:hypothetical protein
MPDLIAEMEKERLKHLFIQISICIAGGFLGGAG